jgi:hypothetical protein
MTATTPSTTARKKRRNPQVHLAPNPIKKLAPRNERTRSVYIVARPIHKAGNLSFLSEGSLPLCHWGLLISPYNQAALQKHLEHQKTEDHSMISQTWGTLVEISQTAEGFHQHDTDRTFGPTDWDYMCIVHVGSTRLSDHKINRKGAYSQLLCLTVAFEITRRYPKYHGYSNNCQNFVQRLLRYVSPGSIVPPTIKEITNLWRVVIHDRQKMFRKIVMLEVFPAKRSTRHGFTPCSSAGCRKRKNRGFKRCTTWLTFSSNLG